MSNAWFRMYAEVLNDPKVQKLPGGLFKTWVNILCIACSNNGTLPSLEDVSFALRVPFHETKIAFQELEKASIVVTDGETFQIKAWKKRQYKSDVSTNRVKRFREKQRNVTETPRAQTDTEQNRTDTEKKESKGRGSRFALDSPPADWIQFCLTQRPDLDAGLTFDKFSDHWQSKPGKDGVKLDWFKTWKNWVRTEKSNQGGNYGKQTKLDLISQGIASARAKRMQQEQEQAG